MAEFTETSHESWFSRLGNSAKGMLTGLVIFILGFPLLFWNEGRAVKTAKALEEGEGAVVSVASDKIDPANEGKLVCFNGQAVTPAILVDEKFGIATNALQLFRDVEMYQWSESSHSETKKNTGGSTDTVTTYDYEAKWSIMPIDSSRFKKPEGHQNPGSFPIENLSKIASPVTVGAFTVPESCVRGIGNPVPFPMPPADTALPANLANGGHFIRTETGFYRLADTPVPPAAASALATAAQTNAAAAVAKPVAPVVPATPNIGDMKVEFSMVLPAVATFVAKQTGKTFTAYTAKNGKGILLQQNGVHDAAEMFAAAKQNNKMMAWILRIIGFFLMFMGLKTIFQILSTVADVLPFAGKVVSVGTGLIAGLIAIACSLLTIGVAWLYYRPVLGISLLVVTVVLFVFARMKMNGAKTAATPASASADSAKKA